MAVNRKFKESPLKQGSNERVAYELATGPWGGSPGINATSTIEVKDGNATSIFISTSVATVSGDDITSGTVQSLIAGADYTLRIRFSIGSNRFEAYGEIECDN